MAAWKRFIWQAGLGACESVRGEVLDAADRILGGPRPPLTPPRRLWHLVTRTGTDFHESGRLSREFLIANGLQAHHRVLDVGCGIGRLAVALTGFLSPEGAYDGFDIVPAAIRWCRTISDSHPNFRFRLVDLRSARYRPGAPAAAPASSFVFPYGDASMDYVVLTSVFTHMLPADMRNYLREIARVMKPGARCMVSYYLMTPERRATADLGGGAFRFAHRREGYWAEFPTLPEAALAYDEAEVLAEFDACGLGVLARYDGEWVNRPLQSQDVLIVEKR